MMLSTTHVCSVHTMEKSCERNHNCDPEYFINVLKFMLIEAMNNILVLDFPFH